MKVIGVDRIYDNYLATQVRSTQSVSSKLEVFSSYAERIDNVLADPNIGLDPAIQEIHDLFGLPNADRPRSTTWPNPSVRSIRP